MPQFNSRRSFKQFADDDRSGEPFYDGVAAQATDGISYKDEDKGMSPTTGMMPITGMTPIAEISPLDSLSQTGSMNPVTGMTPAQKFPSMRAYTDAFSAVTADQLPTTNELQLRQMTDRHPSAPMIVHDSRTNMPSLVIALQSTMQPSTGRMPLVIHPDKKLRRARVNARLQDGHEEQRLNLRVRHILAGVAALCVLMFTMFTMTPLADGQSGILSMDGVLHMTSIGQGSLNFAAHQVAKPQQAATQQQSAATTNTTTTLADTNLPESQYVAIAEQDATKYGISPVYFVRQINQESGFNPYAVSPVGAVGIAQFLPSTAAGLGVNPYDPISALDGAARMMAGLSNQYGGNYAKALAAYNAGSGAVDNAVAAGGANWLSYLPAETQNYVTIIMG